MCNSSMNDVESIVQPEKLRTIASPPYHMCCYIIHIINRRSLQKHLNFIQITVNAACEKHLTLVLLLCVKYKQKSLCKLTHRML